jgi:hypothetical protein
MTLVLSEITKFGIAMVADSAITTTTVMPSKKKIDRVATGIPKLQVIPYLNAGISFWGEGSIPYIGGIKHPTDSWLQDFIERHEDAVSNEEFATELKNELQRLPHRIKEPLGFHLAGYSTSEGKKLPILYNIRNVDGDFLKGYEPHEFVEGLEYSPQPIEERLVYLRNGDYGPYARLSGLMNIGRWLIHEELGLEIPHPSLEGRVSYLTSWIVFISNLYASSKREITIGGDVWALGINPEGEIVINTKVANTSNLTFND